MGGTHESDGLTELDVTTSSLAELSLAELRQSRRDAELEEQELSYVRRLLHGRIDIIRAEVRRRAGEGEELIANLSTILSDHPAGGKPGQGRFVSLNDPTREDGTAREAEVALSELASVNVSTATDGELRECLGSLTDHERIVSDTRAQIHRQIDRLSTELTRRYREGTAQVDDLLAAARRQ